MPASSAIRNSLPMAPMDVNSHSSAATQNGHGNGLSHTAHLPLNNGTGNPKTPARSTKRKRSEDENEPIDPNEYPPYNPNLAVPAHHTTVLPPPRSPRRTHSGGAGSEYPLPHRQQPTTTASAALTRSPSPSTLSPSHSHSRSNHRPQSQLSADRVVRTLRVAPEPIVAAETYSNAALQQQLHQAYARISGRDWTYFVGSVEVVVGNGHALQSHQLNLSRQSGGDGSTGAPPFTVSLHGEVLQVTEVHIDLGPSPTIAPVHAVIMYNPDSGVWEGFAVGGEISIDSVGVPLGGKAEVKSRSVIQMGGTEMLFLLPGDEDPEDEDEEEEEEEGVEVESKTQLPPPQHSHLHSLPQSQQLHPPVETDASASNPQVNVTLATPKRAPNISNIQTRTPAPISVGGGSGQSVFSSPGIPGSDAMPTTPRPGAGAGGSLEEDEADEEARDPLGKTGLEDIPPEEIIPDIDGVICGHLGLIPYTDKRVRRIKPPFSYSIMIGKAILDSEEEQCTLSKIYDHIKQHYAYYQYSTTGWQNSIRHNLSLSRCFEKVARRTDEPGKGMKWRIVPSKREEVVNRGFGRSPRKDTPKKSPKRKSPVKGSKGRAAGAVSPKKKGATSGSGGGTQPPQSSSPTKGEDRVSSATATTTPAPSSPGVLSAPLFESPYVVDHDRDDRMDADVDESAVMLGHGNTGGDVDDDGDGDGASEGGPVVHPIAPAKRPSVNVNVGSAIRRHARSNLDTPLYKPPPRDFLALSGVTGGGASGSAHPTGNVGGMGTPGFQHSHHHNMNTPTYQTGVTPLPNRVHPMLQPPSTAKLPSLMMEIPSSPDGLIYRGRLLVDDAGLPLFGGMWSGGGGGGAFGAVDEAEADCAMQLLDLATSPLKGRANGGIPGAGHNRGGGGGGVGAPGGNSHLSTSMMTSTTTTTAFTPLRTANLGGLQRSSPPPFGRRDRDRDSSPLGGPDLGFGESPIKRDFSRRGRVGADREREGGREGEGERDRNEGRDRERDPLVTPLSGVWSSRVGRFGGFGVPGSSPLRAILNPDDRDEPSARGGGGYGQSHNAYGGAARGPWSSRLSNGGGGGEVGVGGDDRSGGPGQQQPQHMPRIGHQPVPFLPPASPSVRVGMRGGAFGPGGKLGFGSAFGEGGVSAWKREREREEKGEDEERAQAHEPETEAEGERGHVARAEPSREDSHRVRSPSPSPFPPIGKKSGGGGSGGGDIPLTNSTALPAIALPPHPSAAAPTPGLNSSHVHPPPPLFPPRIGGAIAIPGHPVLSMTGPSTSTGATTTAAVTAMTTTTVLSPLVAPPLASPSAPALGERSTLMGGGGGGEDGYPDRDRDRDRNGSVGSARQHHRGSVSSVGGPVPGRAGTGSVASPVMSAGGVYSVGGAGGSVAAVREEPVGGHAFPAPSHPSAPSHSHSQSFSHPPVPAHGGVGALGAASGHRQGSHSHSHSHSHISSHGHGHGHTHAQHPNFSGPVTATSPPGSFATMARPTPTTTATGGAVTDSAGPIAAPAPSSTSDTSSSARRSASVSLASGLQPTLSSSSSTGASAAPTGVAPTATATAALAGPGVPPLPAGLKSSTGTSNGFVPPVGQKANQGAKTVFQQRREEEEEEEEIDLAKGFVRIGSSYRGKR